MLTNVPSFLLKQFGSILILMALSSWWIYARFFMPKHTSIFIEQDLTLSYPFFDATVSFKMLLILSIGFPLVLIAQSVLLAYKQNSRIDQFVQMLINFSMCWLLTAAICETLKGLVGTARPNAFAKCNYMSYDELLLAGSDLRNYYDGYTTFGIFGDVSKCFFLDTDAFLSMPSMHAALMFSSAHITSLFLFSIKDELTSLMPVVDKSCWNTQLKGCLPYIGTAFEYGLAIWVCVTRLVDYESHPMDIVVGTLLGLGISSWFWSYIACNNKVSSGISSPNSGKNICVETDFV